MSNVSPQAEQGARLVKQGHLDEAVREFERALAHNPRDVNALVGLARLRLSRGQGDAGRALLQRLLKEDPRNTEARVQLARLDAEAGNDKALEVLRGLAGGKDAGAFESLSLGQALMARRRFEDAAVAFERALKLEPGDSATLLFLGMARQALGKGEEALRHFQKAAELNPADHQAPLLSARLLVHQGKLDRALVSLKQALERTPDKAELYPELIQLYLLQGDTKGALRAAAEFRTAHPQNAQATYLHGLTNMMMGNTQEAERLLNASLALAPNGIDARLALASIRRAARDDAGALKWLEEAWKLDPQAPGPANELAVLFLSRPGGSPQAVQLLSMALGAHPDEPSLNLNMAVALAKSDARKAREHALKAKSFGSKSIQEHAERLLSRLP